MSGEGKDVLYVRAGGPFNGADRALLARLDERTAALQEQLKTYVTKDQVKPLFLICYGLVGVSLVAVLSAILQTVIAK